MYSCNYNKISDWKTWTYKMKVSYLFLPLEKNVNCLNVLVISKICETSWNHMVSSLYQDTNRKKLHTYSMINVLGSSSIWKCWILNICLDFSHCAPGVDKYFVYSRTVPAGKKQQQIHSIFKIRHFQMDELPRIQTLNLIFEWVIISVICILILEYICHTMEQLSFGTICHLDSFV